MPLLSDESSQKTDASSASASPRDSLENESLPFLSFSVFSAFLYFVSIFAIFSCDKTVRLFGGRVGFSSGAFDDNGFKES